MKQSLSNLILFVLVFTISSCTTERTPTENAAFYLEQNGTMQQYEFAHDELLKLLRQKFPETDANKEKWDQLRANKKQALKAIKNALVPLYVKHFTKEDIDEMIVFYSSDAAKQMLADRSGMTPEQKNELSAFYTTEVGKKIMEKQQVLGTDVATASESWSRELYQNALMLLQNE